MQIMRKTSRNGVDRRPPVEIGAENHAAIRAYFQHHLCATRRECAQALGLSEMAVGRHVRRIRSEWESMPQRKSKR